MKKSAWSIDRGRAVVPVLLLAAFLWALALSASPQLHARIHADANRAEHTCAVTFIASGNYEHAAPPPLVSAPELASQFSKMPMLNSIWVRPLFLCAHLFAHAPPALA